MALKQNEAQVSPLRLKLTLLVAGLGPLVAIGLWLQSKGFFSRACRCFAFSVSGLTACALAFSAGSSLAAEATQSLKLHNGTQSQVFRFGGFH